MKPIGTGMENSPGFTVNRKRRHYWHAGSDGNFYHWKNSDRKWYLYDQSHKKWTAVSGGDSNNEDPKDTDPPIQKRLL